MKKTWGSTIYDSGIATTAGQYDAVNSNRTKTVISKPSATNVIGWLVNYCSQETTDTEIVPDLFIQITSDALKMVNEQFAINHGGNAADANNEYTPMPVEFIGFENTTGKSVKDADFTFRAAPSLACTTGLDVFITTVFCNYAPTLLDMVKWMTLNVTSMGGKCIPNVALAHTGGAEAALANLTIPANKSQIRGFGYHITPDGITEKDAVSGRFKLACEGEEDFTPQEWVYPYFWNSALGTVAESAAYGVKALLYPVIFDLSGKEAIITGTSMIITTAATAPNVSSSVRYI